MVGQINHHLYRKRGFYYFCRRVPKALLEHYPKPRIVVALKTRQFRDALRQSQIISKRLDDQWFHMQLDAMGLGNVQSKLFQPVKPSAPLMSEATSFYLRLKGEGKDKVFARAAQRNFAESASPMLRNTNATRHARWQSQSRQTRTRQTPSSEGEKMQSAPRNVFYMLIDLISIKSDA